MGEIKIHHKKKSLIENSIKIYGNQFGILEETEKFPDTYTLSRLN